MFTLSFHFLRSCSLLKATDMKLGVEERNMWVVKAQGVDMIQRDLIRSLGRSREGLWEEATVNSLGQYWLRS